MDRFFSSVSTSWTLSLLMFPIFSSCGRVQQRCGFGQRLAGNFNQNVIIECTHYIHCQQCPWMFTASGERCYKVEEMKFSSEFHKISGSHRRIHPRRSDSSMCCRGQSHRSGHHYQRSGEQGYPRFFLVLLNFHPIFGSDLIEAANKDSRDLKVSNSFFGK